ncbi:hypothetical protein FQZ97_1080890 [compost metagenome]
MVARAATASGEASGPMSICAALPGRISRTRKTMTEAPIRVPISVAMRLNRNRLMGRAAA